MKPYRHAQGSARRWGGKPEDYLALHDFFDQSKATLGDVRHRALLHSTLGIMLLERVFGATIVNSDGREVCTRDIGEAHVIEDMGFLPTPQDWLEDLPAKLWHGGIHRLPKNYRNQEDAAPMSLKTALEKLTAARATYDAALKSIDADAIARALAEGLPEGYCLAWRQYTPSFNDGDPCTFRHTLDDTHVIKASTLEDDGDREEADANRNEDGFSLFYLRSFAEYKYDPPPPEVLARAEALKAAIAAVNDDNLLLTAFGDGAEIIVYSDGRHVRRDYDRY